MTMPTIPKGLIDSRPEIAVLLDLGAYYAARKLPEAGVDSEVVYDCPRGQIMVRTAVAGTTIEPHFHSVCDEIMEPDYVVHINFGIGVFRGLVKRDEHGVENARLGHAS